MQLQLAAIARRQRQLWNLGGCSCSDLFSRGRQRPLSWLWRCWWETGKRCSFHGKGNAGDSRPSPISPSFLPPSSSESVTPAIWTRSAAHLRPEGGSNARWFGVGRGDAARHGGPQEDDANAALPPPVDDADEDLAGKSSTDDPHPHRYSTSYDPDTGIVTVEVNLGDDEGKGSSETSTTTRSFQTVVGIEIHAQLTTATKLFSSSPTGHGDVPSDHPTERPSRRLDDSSTPSGSGANEWVEPHDMGYPGTLPLLSTSAVRAAVLSAAALNCSVHAVSRFERKHYAYPDLPLGYQVTQQRWPLATDGFLDCRYGWNPQQKKKRRKRRRRTGSEGDSSSHAGESDGGFAGGSHDDDGNFFRVGVERVQIEQDTGKTTILHRTTSSSDGVIARSSSLVDFNRAGRALIEIVFRPDVRSANQAASVVSTLRRLLRHVGTCDGRMEDGSLRCDLNVSVAPVVSAPRGGPGRSDERRDDSSHDDPFASSLPPGAGQRVEVKNLNSVRQVIAATEYEVLRQAVAYCRGRPIPAHETRTFDVSTGQTVKMRRKDGAVDYRFLPEPDLPPLVLDEETLGGQSLSDLLDSLPELPEQTTQRLVERYGLDEDVALVIASDPAAAPLFERAVEAAIADLRGANDNDCGDVGDAGDVDASAVPGAVANWLCNDLFALVKEASSSSAALSAAGRNPVNNDKGATIDDESAAVSSAHADDVTVQSSTVDGSRLGSLVAMVLNGTVSTRAAKQILAVMYKEEGQLGPQAIAEERGWQLIRDPEELRRICEEVVVDEAHEEQLRQYSRGGKKVHKIEKFFIGKAMSACRGNADPNLLLDALRLVLQSHSGVR